MTEQHVCGENMHYDLNLNDLGDTNIKFLDIKGACKVCGRAAVFRGRYGINPNFPTISVGGDEIHLPLLFEGEEYDGKMMGFEVSINGQN